MTEPQTSDQTDRPDLMHYYSLRITIPFVQYPQLQEVINKYSHNYCAAGHVADDEVPHEHYHILFLDLDDKKIDAMKKALRLSFGRCGNGFYAGTKRDNHVFKGLQYVKHDASVTWKHRGSHWENYILEAPDYDHKAPNKKAETKRKREADPMLTYSNILWRAREHRKEHSIHSTDLGVVLEHMTRTTNWIPSAELMRRGLDPLHHRLFEFQASNKTGRTPDWWTPKFS